MASASLTSTPDHGGGGVPPGRATSFGGDAGLATPAQDEEDIERALEWWKHLMSRGELQQDFDAERNPDVNDQMGGDAVLRTQDGVALRAMFSTPAEVLTGFGIGQRSTHPAEGKAFCHAPAPPDGAAPCTRGGDGQRSMFPTATEAPQGLGLARGSTQRRGDDRTPPVAPSLANAASSTRCGTGQDDYREDGHEAGTDSRMRDGPPLNAFPKVGAYPSAGAAMRKQGGTGRRSEVLLVAQMSAALRLQGGGRKKKRLRPAASASTPPTGGADETAQGAAKKAKQKAKHPINVEICYHLHVALGLLREVDDGERKGAEAFSPELHQEVQKHFDYSETEKANDGSERMRDTPRYMSSRAENLWHRITALCKRRSLPACVAPRLMVVAMFSTACKPTWDAEDAREWHRIATDQDTFMLHDNTFDAKAWKGLPLRWPSSEELDTLGDVLATEEHESGTSGFEDGAGVADSTRPAAHQGAMDRVLALVQGSQLEEMKARVAKLQRALNSICADAAKAEDDALAAYQSRVRQGAGFLGETAHPDDYHVPDDSNLQAAIASDYAAARATALYLLLRDPLFEKAEFEHGRQNDMAYHQRRHLAWM